MNFEPYFTIEQIARRTPETPPAPTIARPEVLMSLWPDWALAIAHFRQPGDQGVGDTAQRMAAKVGGEQFKRIAAFFDVPCRCTERQADWNRDYPYVQGV